MTPKNIDDPKLTAYALGELEGQEKLEVEKYLLENEEARNFVEEIQSTANFLSDGLSEESQATLTSNQRKVLDDKIESVTQPKGSFFDELLSHWKLLGSLAVGGAALAIGLVMIPTLKQQNTFIAAEPEVATESGKMQRDLRVENKKNLAKSQMVAEPEVEKSSSPRPQKLAGNQLKRPTTKNIDPSKTGQLGVFGSRGTQKKQDSLAKNRQRKTSKLTPRPSAAPADMDMAAAPARESKEQVLGQVRAQPNIRIKDKSSAGSAGFRQGLKGGGKAKGEAYGIGKRIKAKKKRAAGIGSRARKQVKPGSWAQSRPTEDAFMDESEDMEMADSVEVAEGESRFNTESYDEVVENSFKNVLNHPLSTFSIDVDTASYTNIRRMLNQNQLPPKGAVRIEEMVNYFPYDYPPPSGSDPFSVNVEVAQSPWTSDHQLVRVALKGKVLNPATRPASNIVFLIDVSGSMSAQNKLPLLKDAFKLMVEQMGDKDRVAIAVYAGASGLVLPPTPGTQKDKIFKALDNLQAGGSTNGGAGIELAYKTAQKGFIKKGINRVVLATDGDFNVGTTNQSSLVDLIQKKAKSGVFLTVLGFGMGNYKDSTLEKIANKGNGNYAYIDSQKEARKVLVEQIGSTLVTIAKDVKIQVEFNPRVVTSYRLIGYENRMLKKEDFNNDKVDAGEIGAGHTVTALYEVVPAGKAAKGGKVDALKYQKPRTSMPSQSKEILTVKLRHKKPDGTKSIKKEYPVPNKVKGFAQASSDFQFATAVAGFGMLLRDSKHKGNLSIDSVIEIGRQHKTRNGRFDEYREEFIQLCEKAKILMNRN